MTQDVLAASPYGTYVEHLRRGELAYQVAPDGRSVFFPRVAAPGTGAAALEWRVSRGAGTVYATTAMHARGQAPQNLALIDMDEGFRLMSRVEGVPAQQVRIGQRVQLRVQTQVADAAQPDGDPYPVFTVVAEAAHG